MAKSRDLQTEFTSSKYYRHNNFSGHFCLKHCVEIFSFAIFCRANFAKNVKIYTLKFITDNAKLDPESRFTYLLADQ